jgi:hypothetical protein
MHFCPNLNFQGLKFTFFKTGGFGCDHPIRCNRRIERLTATIANDYNTITDLGDERRAFRDDRDRLVDSLRQVDELAEFATTALNEGEIDDAVELLSDQRELIHKATTEDRYD